MEEAEGNNADIVRCTPLGPQLVLSCFVTVIKYTFNETKNFYQSKALAHFMFAISFLIQLFAYLAGSARKLGASTVKPVKCQLINKTMLSPVHPSPGHACEDCVRVQR